MRVFGNVVFNYARGEVTLLAFPSPFYLVIVFLSFSLSNFPPGSIYDLAGAITVSRACVNIGLTAGVCYNKKSLRNVTLRQG